MNKYVYIVWFKDKRGNVACENPTLDKVEADDLRQQAEALGCKVVMSYIPLFAPRELTAKESP